MRLARTDPITCFRLLSVKGDNNHTPILPLRSDDPDALRHSPLFALIDPDDDLSEVASNLMGPGPWTLHQDLKLPGSCSQMKFSNKNRRSNITVTHTLKIVMRVERGDDLFIDVKTRKRKLFDIVVQTPILILSVSFIITRPVSVLTFKCSADVIQSGLAFRGIQKSLIVQPLLYETAHVALHDHIQIQITPLVQWKPQPQVAHLTLVHR
jgi:hypothetical protein